MDAGTVKLLKERALELSAQLWDVLGDIVK
jgi:hypothetical protein